MAVILSVDLRQVVPWAQNADAAMRRAASMAGSDALKAMRAEAYRRISARKDIKRSAINKILKVERPKSRRFLQWSVIAKYELLPIIAFKKVRQIGKPGRNAATGRFKKGRKPRGFKGGGVVATINVGSPKLIPGAFIAEMKSGHVGVFKREGAKRKPIHELFTSSLLTTFRHNLPAITEAGRDRFVSAYTRLLPLEMAKRSGATP